MKTEGALHRKMSELAIPLTLALLAVVAIISIWTPLTHPEIAHRWFTFPNIIWFMPVPLLVLVCCWGLSVAPIIVRPAMGRLLTLALVFLGFSGLGISIWPNIIPPAISIWQAASPPQSQGFMLVGGLLIIPVILMYTCWSYYVFRGKIKPDEGYH